MASGSSEESQHLLWMSKENSPKEGLARIELGLGAVMYGRPVSDSQRPMWPLVTRTEA